MTGHNTHSGRLPDYFPQALVAAAEFTRLPKGARLFRQGEQVRCLFFVLDGEVVSVRYQECGTEVVMLRAAAGQFFAEPSLVTPVYKCDALCSRDTLVAGLPVEDLRRSLMMHGEFAIEFVTAIARNERRQCSRYERLCLKRADERVLHYLVCESDDDGRLELHIPLYAWAVELGLEAETLYRVLHELQDEARIMRKGRSITLLSKAQTA